MEREERFFHECPECGLLSPWLQGKCDCGYRFKRRLPPDRRLVALVAVLAVLLAGTAGYIIAGDKSAQPAVAAAAITTPAPTRSPEHVSIPDITPFPTVAPRASLPSLASPATAPRPVLIANGEIVKDTALEKLAPFTVETSGEDGHFVFLKCLSVSSDGFHLPSTGDMSFYVSAGQSVELRVPLGEYELYYAAGSTWYGPEAKFGSGTKYYKCEDTFLFSVAFSSYHGWTVTLYPSFDGNTGTETISAAEFPE